MNEIELEELFKMIDKYLVNDEYKASGLEELVAQYVKSRNLNVDWIEVY